MKTRGVRLYGKNDIRLEEFELPDIGSDEILAQVISDSVCMSTYKEVIQGVDHKRVPEDVRQRPIIIGHEFSGKILKVGEKWRKSYKAGDRFAIQPNINYLGKGYAPGYSFPFFGGDSQFIVLPSVVMEGGFLMRYSGDAFYKASLAEPLSCIIGGFRSLSHAVPDSHALMMGPRPGGRMAIIAGAGPMGLGAVDYALHCDASPSLLVVTDIDDNRLNRAAKIFSDEMQLSTKTELHFINTATENAEESLLCLTNGKGFDDIIAFAPVRDVVESADRLLGEDGCLNFFAGPTDTAFKAEINFYNVHYAAHHIMGSSGGNTEDMKIAIDMINAGKLNPSVMITHVGGIDSAVNTTLNLPGIPGGKKLIYTGLDMPLTALTDFKTLEKVNAVYGVIADLISANNGLWSPQAEELLLHTLQKKQKMLSRFK